MIKADNISFSYTDIPLFTGASFTVGDGMKVGVVGPNGAGKSTLFNILLKKLDIDGGSLEITGSVEIVPQEVKHDPLMEASDTVRKYLDTDGLWSDFDLETMLRGLELTTLSIYSSPRNLSGGQKTKLALARALLARPDTLLLDEPTNFLDVEGKQWVMNFLSHYPHTLLLISHDLKLMDKYIDKVIALNPQTRTLDEYNGTYSTYITVKKQQEDVLKRQIITEQKHLKHMKKGLERMKRNKSKKGVRQRTLLRKRIQKIQDALPELPKEMRTMKFRLRDPAWIGEAPIIAKHLYKSYGDTQVLNDVSLTILRYQKIALIGPNGVGKSTLIKILMDRLQPDKGTVLKDEKLKVGYYSQEFETFDMEKTIIQAMQERTQEPESLIRSLLGGFLFSGNKIYQPIGTLSGGEKTRLSIAMLLIKDYNLLILDEPTTYLDVLSQRIILEALKRYKGSMLIVSHTEDFIRELQPTRAMLLPENRVVDWSDDLLDRVSDIEEDTF